MVSQPQRSRQRLCFPPVTVIALVVNNGGSQLFKSEYGEAAEQIPLHLRIPYSRVHNCEMSDNSSSDSRECQHLPFRFDAFIVRPSPWCPAASCLFRYRAYYAANAVKNNRLVGKAEDQKTPRRKYERQPSWLKSRWRKITGMQGLQGEAAQNVRTLAVSVILKPLNLHTLMIRKSSKLPPVRTDNQF